MTQGREADKASTAGALVALICVTVFAAVFIIYTTQSLPSTVATHFGVDNRANGWMSRNGYVLFMLCFLIGVPAFVSFVVGLLPRKYPQWTNLPNRDYWLATARRDESLSFLAAHGMRLACLIVMLMLGMHYTILLANRTQPAALPLPIFSSIFISFALALLWWIVRLYRRFPRPR
jgi:TRAP-type C4-dicarboxylate transport system permease small subunit